MLQDTDSSIALLKSLTTEDMNSLQLVVKINFGAGLRGQACMLAAIYPCNVCY